MEEAEILCEIELFELALFEEDIGVSDFGLVQLKGFQVFVHRLQVFFLQVKSRTLVQVRARAGEREFHDLLLRRVRLRGNEGLVQGHRRKLEGVVFEDLQHSAVFLQQKLGHFLLVELIEVVQVVGQLVLL